MRIIFVTLCLALASSAVMLQAEPNAAGEQGSTHSYTPKLEELQGKPGPNDPKAKETAPASKEATETLKKADDAKKAAEGGAAKDGAKPDAAKPAAKTGAAKPPAKPAAAKK